MELENQPVKEKYCSQYEHDDSPITSFCIEENC